MTTVRRATTDDTPRIADLHVRTWQVAYAEVFPPSVFEERTVARRTAMWTRALDNDDVDVLVAERVGRIIGFVSVGPSEGFDGFGEIYALYVDPDHWRIGAGRVLMSHALELLAERGFPEAILWTLAKSPQARAFYEAHGWRATEERSESFADGVTEVVVLYRRSLS